jgi:outer membrane protein assembly factor BamB
VIPGLKLKPGSFGLLSEQTPVSYNGVLYMPDANNRIWAFNATTGERIWTHVPKVKRGFNRAVAGINALPNRGVTLGEGKVFFDSTEWVSKKKGLPDGLKVDQAGNLFATGPGGVLVFHPDGTYLGCINTGEPTANCGWGDDGSVLYLCTNDKLTRVKTTTKGLGW